MTGRYKAYPKMASASEVIIENHPEHWILTRVKFNSIVKARVGWHGLKSDDFTEVVHILLQVLILRGNSYSGSIAITVMKSVMIKMKIFSLKTVIFY